MLRKCLKSPHSLSVCASLDMSALPRSSVLPPLLASPQFSCLLLPHVFFFSLSHLPLILCPFIKTILKRKEKKKRVERKSVHCLTPNTTVPPSGP